LYFIDLIHDEIFDLSRENVHQQFSVERLKPLLTRWLEALMKALKAMEKPLGFFLYPLKALKKAVGKFLPNCWKRWKTSEQSHNATAKNEA